MKGKLKMSEFENVETIENFMSNFGIVPMETLRDEGLLSFDVVKDRILKLIALNIKNFKENLWNELVSPRNNRYSESSQCI